MVSTTCNSMILILTYFKDRLQIQDRMFKEFITFQI